MTAPGRPVPVGGVRPILLVERQMREIVHSFGFEVFEGPEVETDEYNFENRARPSRAPPSLRLPVAPATLQALPRNGRRQPIS